MTLTLDSRKNYESILHYFCKRLIDEFDSTPSIFIESPHFKWIAFTSHIALRVRFPTAKNYPAGGIRDWYQVTLSVNFAK